MENHATFTYKGEMYKIATNPRPHQVMQSASIETGWLHPDSPQMQPTTPYTKSKKKNNVSTEIFVY